MGTPFDLHVLSTPPAFILSQDQTLNKMVSAQDLSPEQTIFIELSLASKKFRQSPPSTMCSGQLFCWLQTQPKLCSKPCPSGASCFLSRCLIYKVHAVAGRPSPRLPGSSANFGILARRSFLVNTFSKIFLTWRQSLPEQASPTEGVLE